jgi:hypothetical protein
LAERTFTCFGGAAAAAVAEVLTGSEVDEGLAVFARCPKPKGLPVWTREDVQPPARRLYRATASEHFVLGARDERTPVSLGGSASGSPGG